MRALVFCLAARWICGSESSPLKRDTVAYVTAAVIGVVAVLWQSFLPSAPQGVQWVTGLACAAFVEEMVFRVMLPRKLVEIFSGLNRVRAVAVAIVLSQGTFAAAHFTVGAPGASDALRFVQLLSSGLALWAIVQVLGVTVAASIHTIVNVFSILHSSP